MAEHYEQSFKEILINIQNSSPNAAMCLEALARECGSQLAYYGAFILLYLSAVREKNYRPLKSYTLEDFRDFTFYEQAKDNEYALALFTEALRAYQNDRTLSARE